MADTMNGYLAAKEQYAQFGVDTERALEILDTIPISYHCWQMDDITGFEQASGPLSGGIQVTGNHPGKSTTPQQLRDDLKKALSYVPGPKKVNIHANYAETGGKAVDRDEIEPEHFARWADWAVENGYGLDFNFTGFSHPNSDSGYTLSSCDDRIRAFWVEHGKRVCKIAEYLGTRTGQTCVNNIWIPDGEKEFPVDTMTHRQLLKDSLDQIIASTAGMTHHVNAVESKLFGIGSESYVVGSHEFYMGYAMANKQVLLTLDTGHFHPTELVSAKLSALLVYLDQLLLHVSRPVRWDSDHVVAFDDETRAIMREIVRLGALDKVYIATDYFDGSINRVMALAVGARNTKKALLEALLQPVELLKKLEREGDLGSRLAYTEELKALPCGLVWDYYCEKHGIPTGSSWIADAQAYEANVLLKR